MKVLHVIPSVGPVRGGPSQAVLEMVKALQDNNVEAEIVTTNDNGNDLLDVPLGKRIEYQQAPVYFFPRFSPSIHAIQEFAFSSELTQWLWKNAAHYDLLHVHAIFSYTSTLAMLIARLQGIPYISRPLGQLNEWSLQQSARKKQIYLSLIERSNLNHSQALHLTSEQEQQEVSRLELKAPNFILPHGISIPETIPNARQRLREKLQLPKDEPIILFMSRLHFKKGLDYLIPALGKLFDKRFTFVLAGSGYPEYEAHLSILLVNAEIESRTYRCGFVKDEMKNLLLQGSDLFTLTSHSENFGVVVLEALAVGLPVLVTPGVALASVVEQEEVGYVTELDVDAIASTINDCLDNIQEVECKGDRARKFIFNHYTWEKIATKLIEVYNSICKTKPFPSEIEGDSVARL